MDKTCCIRCGAACYRRHLHLIPVGPHLHDVARICCGCYRSMPGQDVVRAGVSLCRREVAG